MLTIILPMMIMFLFIFSISKILIVDKMFQNSSKSIKWILTILIFTLSLSFVVQWDPRVRKTTDKILEYRASKIELKFKEGLSSKQIQRNIDSFMFHFKNNGRKYRAIKSYPRTYPTSSSHSFPKIIVKEQEMPAYYKYENKTLTLYISSSLTETGLTKLERTLETKFMKNISIDRNVSLSLKEKSMPTKFIEKLSTKLIYDEHVILDSHYTALNLLKVKSPNSEKSAICSLSFKIKSDVWKPWYDKIKNKIYKTTALKGLLGLRIDDSNELLQDKLYAHFYGNSMNVKFNNSKEYNASIIYYKDTKEQYLSIDLEKYDQYSEVYGKPNIEIMPTFTTGYEDVKRHCLHTVINRYPYLKSLDINKNFLQNFKGKVVGIKVKNIEFSPYYVDGLIEIKNSKFKN